MARSVCASTIVVAVAILLPGVGSASLPVTLAELVSIPVVPEFTVTTMVKLALAASASGPTGQVTVLGDVKVQPGPETNVTPSASASTTVAPVELEGPLLVTISV